LRELKMLFWVAVTSLELGELLTSLGRDSDAGQVLDEAAEIFTRLGARPWLERLSRVSVGEDIRGRAANTRA
jgi:hypothetical protein